MAELIFDYTANYLAYTSVWALTKANPSQHGEERTSSGITSAIARRRTTGNAIITRRFCIIRADVQLRAYT